MADVVHDVAAKTLWREGAWGIEPGALDAAADFVRTYRAPEYLAGLCGEQGPRHLDSDFELVQDTFRRFAEGEVRPIAEVVHRRNLDIPENVIQGLAEIGTFGVSVPEEYGGFAARGEGEYLAMVVATEELSRGSLGVAGSLITRPEILARALMAGGTKEQKHAWLPRLASGEIMAAIAVTEPDFGSDVAGLRTTARPDRDGWRIPSPPRRRPLSPLHGHSEAALRFVNRVQIWSRGVTNRPEIAGFRTLCNPPSPSSCRCNDVFGDL